MKLRKTILALLLGVFLSGLIASVCIQVSYSSSLPKTPDEKTGQIYRMVVNHGFVVYGSARELHNFQIVEDSQPVAIFSFLFAAILGMSWGIFKIAPGRKLNE